MRSVGSAYAAVADGLGCFFATMLNNVINGLTGNEEEGKPSWLSQNINSGRFDYFYWLLTVLGMINFLFFAKRYKYRKMSHPWRAWVDFNPVLRRDSRGRRKKNWVVGAGGMGHGQDSN
ncbi:major facilitator superfamily protein [Carex littledalei]|uniref:Major facilitator superfamily protein n=1 Tax=Carex littledalei TaxID=544730 RepID=A0A833VCN2_9POAL|nr:major facilitator superfamily protein [Carex littledalei]